tara:strand:- start:77 stop:841 length:765 start_codon:yes stop_codon:yes gene_type:complete
MAQSIRNSLDKFTDSIKSTTSKKYQSTLKTSPKIELETLINTPINSMVSNTVSNKSSLADKASTIASNTMVTASSIFSFRNILFIFLIILLLSFLGFNIFSYLSKGTNTVTGLFGPIFSTAGEVVGDTAKNIVSTASKGTQQIVQTGSDTTKNVVDVAATGTTSSIGFLQDRLKKTATVVNPENNNKLTDNINNNINNNSEPEPVRTSSIQQGYCFIGKINDTRHCAKVNERTQCMSGDIYPTRDICVNPNLRA